MNLRSPKIWGPKVCIIPQSKCSFQRVQLKSSGRKALLAARLRARKGVLPNENKIKIIRDKIGFGAGVWSYDTRVGKSDDHEYSYFAPETLAYETLEKGVRLVKCLEGVEGQIWENNSLVASRWWQTKPMPSQWLSFLRAVDIKDQSMDIPAVQNIPYRSGVSILELDVDHLAVVFAPKKLLLFGCGLWACLFLYFGTQHTTHMARALKVEAEIKNTSEETGLILSQRRRALVNLTQARKFEALGDEALILRGLDSFSQSLVDQGFVLRFVNVKETEFVARIESEGEGVLSGLDLVKRLEASSALTDVNVVPGGKGAFVVNAKLVSSYASEGSNHD